MKPDMTFIGCLLNPDSPVVGAQQKDIEDASRQVGLHVGFWKASKDSELDAAFTSMRERRISALLVPADAYFASSRQKLADLTDRYAIPSMHSLREAAVAGGLMSYGVDLADTYRLIGVYAARVVKGALPSVLPVIQPTKFQFVLNLKTARLLGLSVPPGVLSIVDEVIE
jgi:putative ABC transport system substrate-binding protein